MSSIPPDLRVVCRKLTTAAPADLPAMCPVLVGHILRCGAALAASTEQPGKQRAAAAAAGNEAAVLVHKLRTHVTTLLVHGRTAAARFAGVVLAKAVVDVGGWESLRTAEPWVRGMLSMLQKPDPYASKELCVAVLARLYTLLQAYPTLVREMATPTMPAFATACLQLLAKAPQSTAETVTRALAALVPLYPTTLRPFAAQIRAAVRVYVAPTASDGGPVVPASLRQSARRLLVLLHYTAAKNGHADEWTRLVRSLLRQAHATADQVFRAVRESRSGGGAVSCDGPPAGGGDNGDNGGGGGGGGGDDDLTLPAWTCLQSGAERLQGLLLTLAACFACPTKLPVAVPLGAVVDLAMRLSAVAVPPPVERESASAAAAASLFNPSIGRDERDELWSVLPAIHGATLTLLAGVERRLGQHVVPLAPDLLDATARLFAATRAVPRARQATYALLQALLPQLGPALARPAVDALGAAVHACCADLLAAAGYAGAEAEAEAAADQKQKQQGQAAGQNGGTRRKPTSLTNADLFLTTAPGGGGGASTAGVAAAGGAGAGAATSPSSVFSASHVRAAEGFLACVLRHVPPQHVKKADRARMDRTAILCGSKPAMVASVLQPYVDASGRAFANTIPFLARAFPHDVALEVLRSNLRTAPHFFGDIFAATAPGEEAAGEGEGDVDDGDDGNGPDPIPSAGATTNGNQVDSTAAGTAPAAAKGGFALPAAAAPPPPAPRARPARHTTTLASSLKRKSEEADPGSSSSGGSIATAKRLDTGKAPASSPSPKPVDEAVPAVAEAQPLAEVVPSAVPSAKEDEADGVDSGDESDGSVQLEMVFEEGLDDDDDDDDDVMETDT